jgi:hypothetical protein
MDIRSELLKEFSKAQTLAITDYVGDDPARLSELMNLFLGDEYRVVQRAAWVVSHVSDRHPELFEPYLPLLVSLADASGSDPVVRNVLRVLTRWDLPEDLWGEAYDRSLKLLANPQKPVAIHRYAMEIAWKICREIPELCSELKILIEDGLEHGSPGFRNYGGKVLAGIAKMEGGGEV